MKKVIIALALATTFGAAVPGVARAEGHGKAWGVIGQECAAYYGAAMNLGFDTLGGSHQWILEHYGTELVAVPVGVPYFCQAFMP